MNILSQTLSMFNKIKNLAPLSMNQIYKIADESRYQ